MFKNEVEDMLRIQNQFKAFETLKYFSTTQKAME